MTETEHLAIHKILLVDDDGAVRGIMHEALKRKGFEVVTSENVSEALKYIASERFDVLITDLYMPGPEDGFTVISAMRDSQPEALTVLVSGYPDLESAMDTIQVEADEVIMKPFEIGRLTDLIQQKLLNRKRLIKETVAEILRRCSNQVIENWLVQAKRSCDLNHLQLSDEDRTGHFPKLVHELVLRLNDSSAAHKDSAAVFSAAAVAHGKLRHLQGYTPEMLVHEFRIFQVAIFSVLHSNLDHLDVSLLVTDVMAIADEVDAQLMQTIGSYIKVVKTSAA